MKAVLRTALGIGSGLLILFFTLFSLFWFISDPVMLFGIAFIIASIPYFLWIFPYCTIYVPPDKAWIVANGLIRESSVTQDTFSGHRDIIAQEEFGAGFHFVYFWEFPDKAVDLTRHIIAENDETKPYTQADGKLIFIKWQVFISAIPGYLVHFIKNRPKDVQILLGNKVDGFVQGYVGRQTTDMTFSQEQIMDIEEKYRNEFGPERIIDDEDEKPLGSWLGKIRVYDIDQAPVVQEAKNISQRIAMYSKLVQDLVDESGGLMDHNAAWKFVASVAGNTKIDLLEIGGLLPTTLKPKK